MNHPRVLQTVLDTTDLRGLAEFYRQLLGYQYRPGHETPTEGEDWLVLHDADGNNRLGFQLVDTLRPSTWPDNEVPQQLHLDMLVESVEDLEAAHELALRLGAVVRYDRTDHEQEPLRVYADPSGHPFCIFAWLG
jgi:hypothetical protein